MSLAPFVQILGRGPGRSRSLSRDEAAEAMAVILSGRAAPEAVGALLMLMRMKGETADEIAGFAQAAQGHVAALPSVDLDWPSYAAGRTRGTPWFLLSARLVAASGRRVLLHGWNGADGAVRGGLAAAGIAVARSVSEVAPLLERDRIAYLPMELMAPHLHEVLRLRDVLGLRSCINTVARMLNPGRARASVQGVFHPSYRLLQADAAQALGWEALSVIKGGGGEFERNPAKPIAAFGLRNGAVWQADLPVLHAGARRLADGPADPARLTALWQGAQDPFAEAVVLGTAALALETCGAGDGWQEARALWAARAGLAAA